ncbi:hypothetical protein HPB47_023834, partial [Ixodes persulcatus]
MVRIKRTRTTKVRKVLSSSSENDSSELDAKSKERRTKTARHVDITPTSNSPAPNPRAVPKSAEEATAKFGRRRDSQHNTTAGLDDGSLSAAAEPSTSVLDSSMELCRTSLGTPSYAATADACLAETPPAKRRLDSPDLPGSNSPRAASTPKASLGLTPPGDQVRGQVSAIIDSLPGVDGLDSSEVGTVAGPADPDRPLEGAKVHVEVRCGSQDLSGTLEAILEKLGAEVCDTVGPQLTHVVFRKGRDSTRDMALRWNIPLVGPLWVEGCRVQGRAVSPAKYPAVTTDTNKRRLLHTKHVPKLRKGPGATAIRTQDCKLSQEGKDHGPSVVMTSVPPEDREVLRSVVLALGGFRVEAEVTPGTTHLVVGGAVRTLNLLSAMARGCWVLSMDWVIRDVVREELKRLLPSPERPAAVSIAEAVREEVHRALLPEVPVAVAPERPVLTYAAAAKREPPVTAHYQPAPRREAPAPQYAPRPEQRGARKTDVWRTADRRPMCYHCGEADHIYRRCPYRQLGLRGFAPNDPRPRLGERPRDIEDYLRRSSSPESSPRRERKTSVVDVFVEYHGPVKERSCTDTVWLFLFAAFCAGL